MGVQASVKILCPFDGAFLGELVPVDGGYAVSHLTRSKVVAGVASDGQRVTERRYSEELDYITDPVVLTCAKHGHRTRPLRAEWFQKNAVPAINDGYETVTVPRRHME